MRLNSHLDLDRETGGVNLLFLQVVWKTILINGTDAAQHLFNLTQGDIAFLKAQDMAIFEKMAEVDGVLFRPAIPLSVLKTPVATAQNNESNQLNNKEICRARRIFLLVAHEVILVKGAAIAQDLFNLTHDDVNFLKSNSMVALDELADMEGMLFRPAMPLSVLGESVATGQHKWLFQLHNGANQNFLPYRRPI